MNVAVLDIGPPVEDQERNVIDMGDGRFPRCGVFGEFQVQNSSGIGIVDIDRGRAFGWRQSFPGNSTPDPTG